MRVLVSAADATPEAAGPDAAISWNWVIALARSGEDVTVVAAERHRAAIERWLAVHREVIVSFRYVTLGGRGRLARAFWDARVFVELIRGDWRDFDLMHHLAPRNVASWSFLWLLRRPFAVGPAGGGEDAPLGLVAPMGAGPLAREIWRRARLALRFVDPVFVAMQARAMRVLTTNPGTRGLLWPAFRDKADIGVAVGAGPIDYAEHASSGPPRVLCAGPPGPFGGETLLAEVAAELASRHRSYVVGFASAIDAAALADADIFVSLDLHEADGSRILAAMAAGRPVICLRLGAAPIVAHDAAVVIDAWGRPQIEVVRDLADVIVRLAENPNLRREMARRSRERAALLSWDRAQRAGYAPILQALRG